jgi:hypothetical protein
MKRYLSLFLLLASILYSQTVTNPEWRNYTLSNTATQITEDGIHLWLCTTGGLVKFNTLTNESEFFNKGNSLLPSNIIYSVAVDNDGFKWAATFNGLVKFLADQWQIFNTGNSGLSQNWLTALVIDNSGTKWIGTNDSGLVSYDGTNWNIYSMMNSPLPSNKIKTLLFKNNILWIGTSKGIVKKTGSDFTFLSQTMNISINSMDIDIYGNLWFASQGGLFKVTETGYIRFSDQTINFVKIDNHNVKWFGSIQNSYSGFYTPGLQTVDSSDQNTAYVNSVNYGLQFPWFYSLHLSANGTKYFGTARGLFKLDQDNNSTLLHTSNSKIGLSDVAGVFIDRYDRKWFYNWGSIPLSVTVLPPGYLSLLSGNTWQMFDNNNSLLTIGGVNAAAEGNALDMYFSSYNISGDTEILKYSSGSWTQVPGPQQYMNSIEYMWYDKLLGYLWVSFYGNLYTIYHNSSYWFQMIGYVYNEVNKMLRQGDLIWFASSSGLIKYTGTEFIPYTTSNSGLPHNYVTSLATNHDGNLWIGTAGGLAKFDGTNWTVYNRYNSPLTSDNITGVAVDSSGAVFLSNTGSYPDFLSDGLVKFDGTNWKFFNSKNSGKPDNPLISYGYPIVALEEIKDLAIDASGKIWITSWGGIGVYDKNGIPVPVEFLSFNASVEGNDVHLNWSTATEVNNKGFEIQRSGITNEWQNIGFIEGKGTTTDPQNYSYSDKNLSAGKYKYRLKQIDFDGSFSFSAETEAEVDVPGDYLLYQNYPNPFNPVTAIRFNIGSSGHTVLKVYDILGKEAAVLVNDVREAGEYIIDFDASGLSSGIYFYSLKSGDFYQVRKLVLLK